MGSYMMVIMDQVSFEACDPNFKPPFLVGAPEVLDPYNDVLLPSYGITDEAADAQIHGVYNLWGRSNGISGGRGLVEMPGG
jgi:hypothetical protein